MKVDLSVSQKNILMGMIREDYITVADASEADLVALKNAGLLARSDDSTFFQLSAMGNEVAWELYEDLDEDEDEGPEYHPDCPACLRHLPHTVEEHEQALRRVWAASQSDYDE